MFLRLRGEAPAGPVNAGEGVTVAVRSSGSGKPVGELDQELVEKNRARAVELAEELSPILQIMIERRIPSNLKSRIEVVDVLQGAFLRLRNSLTSRNPGSDETLRAWVIRSVVNEWHDQRRYHAAQSRSVDREQPCEDGSVVMLLAGMGVSTNYGLTDTVERIRDVVKPEVFEIVWFRAVDKLPYKVIGEIVGKTEDAVGKCYVRALEKIKEAVASPFPSSG